MALNAPVDFLPGYRPNLVVRKGGKAKVIEVKSRSSLEANPQVRELARIIDSKPGWSFELLLVAQPERLDSPDGTRSLERGEILRRVEEAEAVLGSGHAEAALLLAWSACEAAVRLLLADEGVSSTLDTVFRAFKPRLWPNVRTPQPHRKPIFLIQQVRFRAIVGAHEGNHLVPDAHPPRLHVVVVAHDIHQGLIARIP